MSDTDKTLTLLDVDKFARFSSSTFRSDKFYKTIGYGLGAMGHLMAHTTQQETETSKGFKAIASNISMARYVIRFTGSLESYAAWKNGSWCYGDDSDHVKRIVSLQALSMLVYYPLEHTSYVGFVAPKLLSIDAMKISRLSCRTWGIYILLDVYANTLRICALTAKEKQIKEQSDLSDEERATQLAAIQARRRELYFVQLRNFFYAGPCIHWCLEKGFLPDHLVSLSCAAEAAVGLWRSWVNTQ
ncbi:uncharacterized protein PITG_00763 [Phytophthora infestans T30-4]|uniref:Peroxisomal biogenesis factor 11 n=2 Tax=Phytophthora infestans TaxID=4787 RepID=D0MRM9_PHYIT|nr:uncharacterized protein PITG_00763 [Phytophthora infestans T30-4]EEY58148.1 conserved hypothetical protein [Phytophthora infestans T30-4]KAF4044917.1 Peroxisomal biogenesis factor 11 (PEX11) [Phytophthora infestans]KAF4147087.1 Peroxisomal biogenesis factor 11 (PEX11) [Phytophthora infestans]KAI9989943.1 hypothetical protein PInf_020247 [Phytophthora infestans]|eukprot:XP_002909334.1 conserved hypothetical protein [Phytophthora infestans T30-4]